jgi:hypothetical protein
VPLVSATLGGTPSRGRAQAAPLKRRYSAGKQRRVNRSRSAIFPRSSLNGVWREVIGDRIPMMMQSTLAIALTIRYPSPILRRIYMPVPLASGGSVSPHRSICN